MGGALIAVLILLAVVAVVDQLFLWFEQRGWMRWRMTTSRSGGAAAGMFGEMQNLFSPSNRHATEEIQHKQMMRQHSLTADDLVDLDTGVARLRRHDESG